ncbi:MAG: hypothetical protein DRG83_18235 [Deltaproteobacteria bacterium]|nr:MAG: hypothetical protein DRG83_18235 [Deltaproteobacteria bacterium]
MGSVLFTSLVDCDFFLFEDGETMSKMVTFLYKLARIANDIDNVKSGDPKKIARRAKNRYVGRKLVRKAWKFPF